MTNNISKKYLIIDRDGTLIIEPPEDFQVDSLEKLEFLPGVIKYLSKIVEEFNYTLILVTNQDGLGTESFPEDTFWPAQNKMLKTLANEGLIFEQILIDKSLPEENKDTRKPGIGMFKSMLAESNIDWSNSVVIGDRQSDIELAKNLKTKSIKLGQNSANSTFNCDDWQDIYESIKSLNSI